MISERGWGLSALSNTQSEYLACVFKYETDTFVGFNFTSVAISLATDQKKGGNQVLLIQLMDAMHILCAS